MTKSAKEDIVARYCKNITALAEEDLLDPTIGRDEEIRRVIQILTRRSKNNPILIGASGVGKTTIVYGLAQRIVVEDVPEYLKNKKILSLDIASLLAGASYRGEFEERLLKLLRELESRSDDLILFLDNIHNIVGAGKSEGGVDASSMLEDSLSRSNLRVIGTTSIDEYKKTFEKNKTLDRRFQAVFINAPSVDVTLQILRGLKEKFETYHGIQINDSALIAAATLSNRYLTERNLPDKAIDLLDEACSLLKTTSESKPHEIDLLEREVISLRVNEVAIRSDRNVTAYNKLKALLRTKEDDLANLKLQWSQERTILDEIASQKELIEELFLIAEESETNGDYEQASKIRYSTLIEAEQTLLNLNNNLANVQGEKPLLSDALSYDDIAKVIGQWTGIKVNKLKQSESQKLLHMEDNLHKRVIGQHEAIVALSKAVRRARAGLQDANRPTGSFLFLGPTGVGKTELAKALAEFLFDDENAIVRIDMSEYMEKHTVSRLLGSPPGYAGHDEGGQLTEAVLRRPYSVVLFDEIEKAHPDVFNVFLQLLDEGRLTDSRGRSVDFKNTVIIMTSNIGSVKIFEAAGNREKATAAVEAELLKAIKPEILNRIDSKVIFDPLTKSDISKILDIHLHKVQKQLADKELKLIITPEAKELLVDKGYDPAFGGRPLKRAINNYLLDPLSNEVIGGIYVANDIIYVTRDQEKLKFSTKLEGPSPSR